MTLTIEQYKDAIKNVLSEKQIEILKALYHFPNSTATAKDLADALNYKSYHGTNRHIGLMGKKIADYLGVIPDGIYYDRGVERPAYFLLIGPYHSHEGKERGAEPGWEMVENMRKALEELSLVSQSQLTTKHDAYLFIWNSKPENFDDYDECLEEIKINGECEISWLCMRKQLKPGDRIFFIKIGVAPKGMIGSGIIKEIPESIRNEKGNKQFLVKITLNKLLDYRENEILKLDRLERGNQSCKTKMDTTVFRGLN
jgi:hypothetical protein